MATQICNGTGNLTGASTFAGAETGALALVLNRSTIESLAAAASVTSVTFTITNTHVIDAVLLWVRVAAAAPTGTFKVDLQLAGVSQATCTVNKTDLPQFFSGQAIGNMVPVLFKLGSNVTSAGAATYTIVLTTTGTVAVNYAAASASTTNFTRALRTTTAATAAAADDLYVIGELTGAGTNTARTVTMNQTAATAYGNGSVNSTTVAGGGIHVGWKGTLSYGTTASTNFILRINGDLWVWEQGPFNIGSSGSEIPRNSTAVLEFQPVSADGDFGLRIMDNAIANIAGLSRTSAKNIVQCNLTSDVTGSNVLTSGPTALNVTNATSGGVDAGGSSLLASTAIDTVTSANHTLAWSGPSITNTTQSFQVWLARGTGTNNRFVRLEVGNNAVLASVTKGFFADVDLQAGTIGTCTAVGTGTATSSAITAVGGGFLCTIVGKVDGSAATPTVFIAICSAAGTTSFAGANNQALLYEGVQLVTTASIGDTTFNVDADTGWLSGDQIILATTSKTPTDTENFVLSANAGASSLVSHLYPFGYGGPTASQAGTHNGTSPIQAEVGLLTRNVKIRSTSSTLMSYVYCTALSTVTFSWAEFYYIGVAATATKRGIEVDVGSTAGVKSITFCSIHDGHADALYCNNSQTSLNLTFSNNIVWNVTANAVLIAGSISNTDWTISNNLVMRMQGASNCYSLADLGGTFSNNTAVGCGAAASGFALSDSTFAGAILGTMTGNVAHSCNGNGMSFSAGLPVGTFEYKGYHNGSTGLSINCTSTLQLVWNNLVLFGNGVASANLSLLGGDAIIITGSSIIAADTFSAQTTGISISVTNLVLLDINGLDMSGVGSIFAPHGSFDFLFGSLALTGVMGTLNNCKFGAPLLFSAGSKGTWSPGSYMSFEKYGQTAGDHRTEMTYGQIKTDSTIFNLASPSMRLTPNNVSSKMESAPKGRGIQVAVASGQSINIAGYLYKSKTGDGAAYNGNQPRLIQRANAALGQTSDVVLATYGSGTGSWNQISGNSSTATDDGVWEFVIDCDGTAGWINVDDLQAA